MAKNKDRRNPPKEEKKRQLCPFRKPRPDLMPKVQKVVSLAIIQYRFFSAMDPMEIAKGLGCHVDDVKDCLVSLAQRGEVLVRGDEFFPSSKKDPPPPPPPPKIDFGMAMKIKKAIARVGWAKREDFDKYDGAAECIEEMLKRKVITIVGGNLSLLRPTHGTAYTHTPTVPRRKKIDTGSWTCVWCNRKTRRHARSEVHDPEQCRMGMIAVVMGS